MDNRNDGEMRSRYILHSPILWQNSEQTVTLLDIPQSISKAQEHKSPRQLLSSSPLLSPFPSNEPKTASAKAKLAQNTVDAELHSEYAGLLTRAIEDVRTSHDGPWCLPRPFREETSRPARKRNFESNHERTIPLSGFDPENSPSAAVPTLNGDTSFFSNDGHETVYLHCAPDSNRESHTYFVPPRASFYLGDCADAHAFHTAIRSQAKQVKSRKDFDFILLDPPWPNRSVRRTHRTPGSTYSTSPSLLDLRELILDMRLDSIMAEDCLVGVWLTNKPAVRELVLGENGIFACWNVELIEEWIWLKTTMYGEPMTALSALWRKPYEVLLLGRKRRRSESGLEHELQELGGGNPRPKRRVILSVPDLHSRKPCLKELIEPLMHDRSSYRALEVFARHLVAGWWSWGDECIKFNLEHHWRDENDDPEQHAMPSIAKST